MTTEASETRATATLSLHNATVLNRTMAGGELGLHDELGNKFSRVPRGGHAVVSGKFDWIYQRGLTYRFAEAVETSPGDVVVITNAGLASPPVLSIWIRGAGEEDKHITTLGGERIPLEGTGSAGTQGLVDAAPSVALSTETLADVVFTSSLNSSMSALSLNKGDQLGEQQALLDDYKRTIDGMLYRHSVTTVEIGSFWSKVFNIGPLDITVGFDFSTLEGYVEASVLGISLGSAKFGRDTRAKIGIDIWIASAGVEVWYEASGIWMKAWATTKFNGSANYGPKEIIHI